MRRGIEVVVAFYVCLLCGRTCAAQDFEVVFEDANVVLAGNASIDFSVEVAIRNTTTDALPIAAYTLFVDVGPIGFELPNGIQFAEPSAVFYSNYETSPFVNAPFPGIANTDATTLAAGDIGLGEGQLLDGFIGGQTTVPIASLQLTVDPTIAVDGSYSLQLSDEGQSSIVALSGPQSFSTRVGTLTLSLPEFIAGDYNGDGVVDGADYTVWRDNEGTTGLDAWAPGDGNGDGDITQADYDVWRSQFGMTLDDLATPTPAAEPLPIPEPATLALAAVAVACLGILRRR